MIRKIIWPLLTVLCLYSSFSFAQSFKLPDGRNSAECKRCLSLLEEKPKEVLFGIYLHDDGNIYFGMSNKEWFNKFFTGPMDGIAVDLVPRERYRCDAKPAAGLILGTMIKPVYLAELKKNMEDLGGDVSIKLGQVPENLRGKDIEGNIVLINNGKICYTQNFIDISRSLWELLPMGLFADALMQQTGEQEVEEIPTPYVTQLEFTIPFGKNSSTYNEADLKPIRDSLERYGMHIARMHIRAYSSVEGSVTANAAIQKQRAAAVIKALQQQQPRTFQSSITTLENWMEFYRDITGTSFDNLKQFRRQDIKRKLKETSTLNKLEPTLQKHRKAVVTLYLDKNSGQEKATGELADKFKLAINQKNLKEAAGIQREVFNRIADNRLPSSYLGQLEIPQEKQFSGLLTNQVTFGYLLNMQYEEEALEAYRAILRLDPDNGKTRYNICALGITLAANDSTGIQPDSLLNQIQSLTKYRMSSTLISRMKLNLNIILSEYYQSRFEYDKKDKAVNEAVQQYHNLELKDAELLSMAKYLAYYSLSKMAADILEYRVGQIDVSEDLVFYYLNLKLFYPILYETESFRALVNNALTLNSRRFCRLFRSSERGGVGFQLLEEEALRKIWCEQCSTMTDLDEEEKKQSGLNKL